MYRPAVLKRQGVRENSRVLRVVVWRYASRIGWMNAGHLAVLTSKLKKKRKKKLQLYSRDWFCNVSNRLTLVTKGQWLASQSETTAQ